MLLALIRLSAIPDAPRTALSARVEIEFYDTHLKLSSSTHPGVLLHNRRLLLFAPNIESDKTLQCQLILSSGTRFPGAARVKLSGNAFSTATIERLRVNPWIEIRGDGQKLNVRVTIDPKANSAQQVVELTTSSG